MSGCAIFQNPKKIAKVGLEEKYGERFVVSDMKNAGFFADYYYGIAYSEEYPDLKFEVDVNKETGNIGDEYVSKRVCQRLSEQVMENISTLPDECYVYAEPTLPGSTLTNANASLSEFLSEGFCRFHIYVFIQYENSTASDIAYAINHLIDSVGSSITGSAEIYLMDEEMINQTKEYLSSHIKVYSSFDDLTEEYEIGNVLFTDGNILVSETDIQEMIQDWNNTE